MDFGGSQNPLGDQLNSSSDPPDEGSRGGGEGGGSGGESSVLPRNPEEEEEGSGGRAPEPDLDSRVVDVEGGHGGCAGIKAAEKENVRRKRGRASRVSLEKAGSVLNPPRKREKKDEEDVCFICFDGGELVVCDRRGCPKVYHPTCVKRSPSFFQSKAKWNCGWHICTSCQKTAHYMCYTCPHSLCKSCYRNADFVCIRESKGLCRICRETIVLIENIKEENTERVHVDFDDKSSWEYLFKMYWTDLKAKLSLTVDEITQAKNFRMEKKSKSRKTIQKLSNGYAKSDIGRLGNQQSLYLCETTGWASDELLEFVAYMKGGSTAALSRFEVQALLLEYVNSNNLRDPKQKWEISCDVRLGKLFRKASVDHFEMLKLLDSHFCVKEVPQLDGVVRGTGFDAVGGQMNIDLNKAEQPVVHSGEKLETCRKLDAMDNLIDQDDYAVLDSHRISSIYLRRNLVENLIDDVEQFQAKVVGSIVRKRISGKDQGQDLHRLVQVVGTIKETDPYKIGDKYTNIKLEILNFDRKEVIPIDEISDHDYSEEEIRQFNHNIRCGKVKWFGKDEIQGKALTVKAERVTDESSNQLSMMVNKPLYEQGGEISRHSSWNTVKSHGDAISSVTRETLSGTISEISPSPLSTGTEQSVNDDETYKMWQYQDSNGMVQGPFTMLQMRNWRTVGHFPHHQRIWRMDEKQEDSILLTEALEGHFHKESPALQSREDLTRSSDDRDMDGVSSITMNTNATRSELGSYASRHTIKTETESSQGLDRHKGISSHHQIGFRNGSNGKEYDVDGYSSTHSSGQNWKAPSPVVSSSNEYPRLESSFNSLFPGSSSQKPVSENLKFPNSCVENLVQWNSNHVSASSQEMTAVRSMDGSGLTLGSSQQMPPASTVQTPFSWQAMILEPVEFTALPEESVSDLLAELEASEPLTTTFPSPNPKSSDGSIGKMDCYSHDAGLFSVSQLGNEPHGPGYFNPYSGHGLSSQVSSLERIPETWEKQHQQQTSPYYGGNGSSNHRGQFFDGLNLDLGNGRFIWDRQ